VVMVLGGRRRVLATPKMHLTAVIGWADRARQKGLLTVAGRWASDLACEWSEIISCAEVRVRVRVTW
jgi:hypothetical protein